MKYHKYTHGNYTTHCVHQYMSSSFSLEYSDIVTQEPINNPEAPRYHDKPHKNLHLSRLDIHHVFKKHQEG
jgi:hypothetical protein